MTTYATIKSRIANELDRDDLTAEISLSVQDAIKHYQHETFWFNSTRAITFNTVASQEFYTSSDEDDIPNLLTIHQLTITVNSNRYKLTQRPYEYLEELATNASYTGRPSDFSYYAQALRLWPIPDGVYAVRISGRYRFTALSADGDTNSWVTDAEPLIRARAKWDLYTNLILDQEQAAVMRGFEADAMARLSRETTRRLSTGRIIPTDW